MANNSSLSKRAALRLQQEQDERVKRNKRIAFAGVGLVVLVAIVVLAIVIVQAVGKAGSSKVTENQLTPPNATKNLGILMDGKKPSADKPHVVIWEDFQCPACKIFEDAYGSSIVSLLEQNKITVEIRMTHFLDDRSANKSSTRAAIAASAADEVGKFRQFHTVVFANQPQEGVGYTDAQLRDEFPKKAGIEGEDLKRFQELYDTMAFKDFVNASDDKFKSDKIPSTPTYLVAGAKLEFQDDTGKSLIQPTPDDFLRAVTEAWEKGGKSNDF